jgi:hypothetical protein
MVENANSATMAWRYELEVPENGRVELAVPFSPGSRVVVLVMEESEEPWRDLVAAAQSTLDFWDNPQDDEDWNRAATG